MERLILVRHGETDQNKTSTIHSVDDQETLNERGVSQIQQTAERLKAYGVSQVYSSDKQRALQSARLISEALGVPMKVKEGLHERNWGIYAGRPWEKVEAMLNTMDLETRYDYVPEGGESWRMFEQRLGKAVEEIREENPDGTVTIVTHGGAIRALIPFLNGSPKQDSFLYQPGNASVTLFSVYEKRFSAILVDDVRHLGTVEPK